MLEEKIKKLRKFVNNLKDVSFTKSPQKNGTVMVKYGKKYVFVTTPSGEWADRVIGEFQAVLQRQIDAAEIIIDTAEKNCEQQILELFGKVE